MKVFYWLLGVLLGIPTLLMLAVYGASELGGEVVTLDRTEANGEVSPVRIWIVDSDGASWIEHGAPDSAYITRLSRAPNLVLNRAGRATHYVGTPDRDSHDLYHRLRREKYGIADQIVQLATGSAEECPGVPIRLQLAE
jgi:hypothetical protein